jgi:hypothetical protein
MSSESARTVNEIVIINLLFLQPLIPVTNETHDWDSGTRCTINPKHITDKTQGVSYTKARKRERERENHECINE